MERVVKRSKIRDLVKTLRDEGKKIVFTNGCFDILHRGHIEYLLEAKMLGDILIVGINSDASVKKIKGKNRPINNEKDRAFVLSMLKPVDYVVIFEEETPLNLITEIVPDTLVKGGDWDVDKIIGREIVEKNGGRCVSLKFLKGYSTSKIIEKIKNGI